MSADHIGDANKKVGQDCEPVAWLIDWPDDPDLGHYFAEQPCLPELGRSTPLYAAPPKREPLSREKIRHLMSEAGYVDATPQEKADFINGARFAEKAHGIWGQS